MRFISFSKLQDDFSSVASSVGGGGGGRGRDNPQIPSITVSAAHLVLETTVPMGPVDKGRSGKMVTPPRCLLGVVVLLYKIAG